MCQFSPCGKPWLHAEQGERFTLSHRRRLGALQGLKLLVGNPSIYHHFYLELEYLGQVCRYIKVWLLDCTWLLHPVPQLKIYYLLSPPPLYYFFFYQTYPQRRGIFCTYKKTSVSSNLRGKEPVRTFGVWSSGGYRRRKLIKETFKTMKKASQKCLLSLAGWSPEFIVIKRYQNPQWIK